MRNSKRLVVVNFLLICHITRHDERFGLVVKAQADLESRFTDLQIPELILEHDGHVVGILVEQALADADAGRLGHERDEEMVLAGEAGLGDFGHDLSHDAARRFLQKDVVSNVILSHVAAGIRWPPYQPQRGPISRTKREKLRRKMQASVARCLRTPPVARLGAEDLISQC